MNTRFLACFLVLTALPHSAPKADKRHTVSLCTVRFGRFKAPPQRVDGEASACLDDIALNAQRDVEARLVIVGNATTLEMARNSPQYSPTLPARRASSVAAYLVAEKGIAFSRIQLRTGRSGTPDAQSYLVPPNADFDADVPGTTIIANKK